MRLSRSDHKASRFLPVMTLVLYFCAITLAAYELNQLNGLWSPSKYYDFLNTFKYDDDKVVLDKYTIIEPERIRKVYNWLQYFEPEDLEKEFKRAGFSIRGLYSDVAGTPFPFDRESEEFAIISKKL